MAAGDAPQPPPLPANERLVTVRDADLSRWQSAAVEVAHRQLAADQQAQTHSAVHSHPLVRAVTSHVEHEKTGEPLHHPLRWLEHKVELEIQAALSQLHFHFAQAQVNKDLGLIDRLLRRIEEMRRFSNVDPGWAETEAVFIQYWAQTQGHKMYRNWQAPDGGGGDPNFGVIDWQLPAGAKVAILGDWGTGMDDARAMLAEILDEHHPDVILHLGDIYYSGTNEECSRHFADLFDDAFKPPRHPVPVYTIPGNHDYYAWGVGFYDMLDHKLNQSDPSWHQQASYFCLRSADAKWQFLGMDTGQADGDPLDNKNPRAAVLRDSEKAWLADKMNFPGTTILLVHNQVFSAHSTINVPPAKPYLNDGLMAVFEGHYDKIAAWFWGHEHTLVLFRNGLFGLKKGRLVGASAFESTHDDNPYGDSFKGAVPEQLFDGQPVRVGMTQDYYNHSYAIIDLAKEPAEVAYYQIASWAGSTPIPLPEGQPKVVASETLD